jgi:hypothetical protein
VLVETEGKGFSVKWIRSDVGPAMSTSAMAQLLSSHGTSTDKPGLGQYAPRVERRIQLITAKVEHEMSLMLLTHSVLTANGLANMQQAASSAPAITPGGKLLVCQVDYGPITDALIDHCNAEAAREASAPGSDHERTVEPAHEQATDAVELGIAHADAIGLPGTGMHTHADLSVISEDLRLRRTRWDHNMDTACTVAFPYDKEYLY